MRKIFLILLIIAYSTTSQAKCWMFFMDKLRNNYKYVEEDKSPGEESGGVVNCKEPGDKDCQASDYTCPDIRPIQSDIDDQLKHGITSGDTYINGVHYVWHGSGDGSVVISVFY